MNGTPGKNRRSIRLRGYDYGGYGYYFVTICTHGQAYLFGSVMDGVMQLNEAGRIVDKEWVELPRYFPGIRLGEFVVMPNHVHGIIMQPSKTETSHASAIGSIIRSFKARCTVRINQTGTAAETPLWQRNYYEHIIRKEESLSAIIRYIRDNPRHWHQDPEHGEM